MEWTKQDIIEYVDDRIRDFRRKMRITDGMAHLIWRCKADQYQELRVTITGQLLPPDEDKPEEPKHLVTSCPKCGKTLWQITRCDTPGDRGKGHFVWDSCTAPITPIIRR